ncbi:hypothetical protein AZH51_18560 [Branchiibius sp. NY16-3462-2]|nr:hypothetical protein AZH51_18560 [Branchiibius sp. NY16-3462-2]
MARIVRRWHELPQERAAGLAPTVHEVTQALADETARACGRPAIDVPQLGVSVLADQLRVITYDALQAGLDPTEVAARLTALRRTIA